MQTASHRFHIPVMGLSYTIDTPIKLAKYGIDSVVSIVQDDVIEKARRYYSNVYNRAYTPITRKQKEYRSSRITAYLNLVNELVDESVEHLRNNTKELEKYHRLLPNDCSDVPNKTTSVSTRKGSIDVNIMTKLDRMPLNSYSSFTEACSALKGYAESDLDSKIILSAGLNPRLFTYMQTFKDFYPDLAGHIRKRIVIKVSDFRSALIQGKMLAKKGLWVSEYRIESGLNCGGHTFATDGMLLGRILEQFKAQRESMFREQYELCKQEWIRMGYYVPTELDQNVTVQGGLGNNGERMLMETYYKVDATGWGSLFLLVPEATSLDDETLQELMDAGVNDIYNSDISPLGVRFNTIRNNSGERQKRKRAESGQPGSHCDHKHLALDQSGICTASSRYQKREIRKLKLKQLTSGEYSKAYQKIIEKECICEGLATSFERKFHLSTGENNGVSICPGPNLAYFNRTYTLEEMVDHIYGKASVLEVDRPHIFIKELEQYLNYYNEQIDELAAASSPSVKEEKRLQKFYTNLIAGIDYYGELQSELEFENLEERRAFCEALQLATKRLESAHNTAIV